MRTLEKNIKKIKRAMLVYTLYSHNGKYIISVLKDSENEKASVMLPDSFNLQAARSVYKAVCKSRTMPCALCDIVDDLLSLEYFYR